MGTNLLQKKQRELVKIFSGSPKVRRYEFENTTGAALEVLVGTVVGKIAATGKIGFFDKTATNGLEHPIGIVMMENNWGDYKAFELETGATESLPILFKAGSFRDSFSESKLVFVNSETLSDVLSDNRTVRDHLEKNTGVEIGVIIENTL